MKTIVTTSRMTCPEELQAQALENEPLAQFITRLRRCGLAALLLASVLAGWAAPGPNAEYPHGPQPFSRIFVFADSLSDTGNLFHFSGGFPPPPYFQGRFSNGPLWVEYLADALGMSIIPGDNYAVGGATTGTFNSNNGINGLEYPGLKGQLDTFEATRTAAEAQGALFVVWAGANDFLVALKTGQSPAELIGNGVGNTVQAIQRLWQAGAHHILVVNVPDIGLTPRALALNAGAPITQLCAAYNQVLDTALNALAAAGIPTIRVDAFATLQVMVNEPDQFGFTNVTDPLKDSVGNADEFLFWDDVHPTTVGHAVLADAAADSLISYFSPRRGKGTPAARINSLNGLVNAWGNN